MKSFFKKPRIFHEQVKDRHTSHWDLDMLSHAELEALMAGQGGTGAGDDAREQGRKNRARRN